MQGKLAIEPWGQAKEKSKDQMNLSVFVFRLQSKNNKIALATQDPYLVGRANYRSPSVPKPDYRTAAAVGQAKDLQLS